MHRQVEPELLDSLPQEDPAAARSRRDLRRINWWMGNPRIVARAVRSSTKGRPLGTVLELGAGDGHFLLQVLRRLGPPALHARALLLDRLNLVSAETEAAFRQAGWRAEPIHSDVFDWLLRAEHEPVDVLVGNLFLHHFRGDQLQEMFRLSALRAPLLVAVEPRRSPVSLMAARLLGAIGCNLVTRHDAVTSVGAGFTGKELTALWPAGLPGQWVLAEQSTGLFSHLFVARLVR